MNIITNENFNLKYEKEKIKNENEKLKDTNKQLKEKLENLKHQLNQKDNEIRTEKLKQEKLQDEIENKELEHKKIVNEHLIEIKVKEVELKNYISKYTSLKQKENGEDEGKEKIFNVREEIINFKNKLKNDAKLELEHEKDIYIKRKDQEYNRKNNELESKMNLVEIKAEEEVENYKKKLKEEMKKEIEEFKKNYEVIQFNEIREKEIEVENKYKEALTIKKQELERQESKLLKVKKQDMENAFNRIIKIKQAEYEDKYKRRVMNLKLFNSNDSSLNMTEFNKNIMKIINDLKDQINSLTSSLLLEKKINENNNKRIQILEEDHRNKTQQLLQNHFNHIDNNTLFNNKALSLFDKSYLEKIYFEITKKFTENISNGNMFGQMDEKSYMEKRINEILASFQIYSWKLRETIKDYENKIKNFNCAKQVGVSKNINEELIHCENKYILLMKEKEGEYLRILTELELDNYIKENKISENSLFSRNNYSFDKNHYESRLKALEVQYNNCMNILESEKKISNRLLNENKELNHHLIKEQESAKDSARLAQKYKELYNQYRQKLSSVEDKYKSELKKRSKIVENCIRQIKQKQAKHNKLKTVEFVNIDGVVNTYKREDDGKTEDDSHQKYQSELTTGDFATSLYTDRYTTRDNEEDGESSKNETSENDVEDKETESLQTESFEPTTRTTELSTDMNETEEDEEDSDDDDDDNNDDVYNNSDHSNNSDDNSDDKKLNKISSSSSKHDHDSSLSDSDDSLTLTDILYHDGKKKSKKQKKKHKKSKKKNSGSHDNEKSKSKNEHKKSKSSKKEKKNEDSPDKKRKNSTGELSISKENIIPNEDGEKKYVLRNKDNKGQSIELYNVDDLESSEEEEVSESIKEEIRSLLEDIPELKSKYQILNKTGEGIIKK